MRSPLIAALCAASLLAVSCQDSGPRGPAAIYIAVEVRADEPMTFGFGVAVDGELFNTIPFAKARFTIPNLAPGSHVVSTVDLPSICAGGEPREVSLGGGDTLTVQINLACSRTSADISVQVTTAGFAFDPDGYDVLLDGIKASHVKDGTTILRFQPVGPHVVSLGDLAGNCVASAPVPIQLNVGTQPTTAFTVNCSQTGLLKVVSNFTGADIDPDGVVATLDGATPIRSPSSLGAVRRVPVGSHTFAVTDIAPNCTTTSALTGALIVGPTDTAFIRVSGTCSSIGMGTAVLIAPDSIGDALSSVSADPSFDLSSVTVRTIAGWLTLVLHFANVPNGVPAALLFGNIDLDTDESAATGAAPLINLFGGHATQGADYSIILSGSDVAAGISRFGVARDSLEKVRLVTAGDSVVVRVSLNKLGGDDGNLTATILVGSRQQPTDVAPNNSVIVVRRVAP